MSDPEPSPAARRPRRLSPARRALFAGVVLAVGLGVAEVLARLVTEEPNPSIFAHPYCRRVRAPNQTLRMVSPLDGTEFELVIDGHGFRSRSLEPPGVPKPADTYRVFFVGGSTTENVVLPDEQTFPAIIEAELSPRVGKRLRCVNAGLSGNVVSDTFSLVAHKILALEPDLIVALEGINDMCLGMSRRYDPHASGHIPPARPSLSDLLLDRFRLLQLADRLTSRSAVERRVRLQAERRGIPFTPDLDPTRALPSFRRYLKMTAAVCREAGVPLLLLTMPTIYRPELTDEELASLWMGYLDHGRINADHRTMLQGMKAFNDAIREVAQEEGTLFLDLDAAVPKDLEHFYDDCHYTARGSRVVADRLMDFLSRGLP